MKALGRKIAWPLAVLSPLLLQACQSAGTLALAASMWSVIIIASIVSLPFLPFTLGDMLKKAPPGPTAVEYASGGDWLVVAHKDGAHQHLDRMDLKDLSVLSLTSGKRFDLNPEVSPDGQSIVFVTATKPSRSKVKMSLCIQSIDGSNPRMLTNGTSSAVSPWFSPDGTKVVYVSSANDEEADLFVIDVAGGEARRLTSGPDTDFYPFFLPDNERILFARATFFGHFSPIASSNWHKWDWYTVRLDGTGLTRLTNHDYYDIAAPELSADGKRLLFSTGTGSMGDNAWLLHLDGEPRAELLRPTGSQYILERDGEQHVQELMSMCFSPEGDAVLFTMEEKNGTGAISEVHRMDLTTGEANRLTHLDTYIREVTCSPRGDSLALLVSDLDCKKSDCRAELWITDLDGTNPRRPDFGTSHPKTDADAR